MNSGKINFFCSSTASCIFFRFLEAPQWIWKHCSLLQHWIWSCNLINNSGCRRLLGLTGNVILFSLLYFHITFKFILTKGMRTKIWFLLEYNFCVCIVMFFFHEFSFLYYVVQKKAIRNNQEACIIPYLQWMNEWIILSFHYYLQILTEKY